MPDGVWLTSLSPGVSRVGWSPTLQARGYEEASALVRSTVTQALTELGQARVEALVDPADAVAVRIATWSGLHREGVVRGAVEDSGARADRVLFGRLADDVPVAEAPGFRAVLNSFLPRKRAIAQMLVRSTDGRVLLCRLTYKRDWDLPGGVVEVGESPRLAAAREVGEELGLTVAAGGLVLTDWLPAWSGWDDAVCLVFDGGLHDPDLISAAVLEPREIVSASFHTIEEAESLCADFTARRIASALASLDGSGVPYTESGRPV